MISEEEIDVRTPVRVSLIKNDLMAGCERVPVVFVSAFIFICIITLHTLMSVLLGVVLIIVAFPVLRYLAKRDPQFTAVMLRHTRYQSEYSTQSSLARVAPYPPQRP
jgi:type IV secretory pathway TrbD component